MCFTAVLVAHSKLSSLAEDSGDRGEEQAVEFRKVLRRQVPARFERAGRQ